MAVLWATGFEAGSTLIFPSGQCSGYISASGAHTGAYCLRLDVTQHAAFTFAGVSEVYAGVWVYLNDTDTRHLDFKFGGAGGENIVVRCDYFNWRLVLYVNDVAVAYGTHYLPANQWFNLQFHVLCADSGGLVEARIDGVTDISYLGDTKVANGLLEWLDIYHVYFLGPWSWHAVDDVTIRDDTWPGDMRYIGLMPDGDVSVQWTPSEGTSNYACLDEIPPTDADYVYTETDGARDVYTLQDYESAELEPVTVTVWVRGWKGRATADRVKVFLVDGAVEDGKWCDLYTSPSYAWKTWEGRPAGGAWTDAALDALKVGIEADFV